MALSLAAQFSMDGSSNSPTGQQQQPAHQPHPQSQQPQPQIHQQHPNALATAAPQPVYPHWTPSPTAAPFYPAFPGFFQSPQAPQQPPAGAIVPPFFDPNQQFAQWAYQQMLFNAAAAQQQQQQQQQFASDIQRGRTNSNPQQAPEFIVPPAHLMPFQSGTPPPYPQQYGQAPRPDQQYQGFHPYRRPGRQDSQQSASSAGDWPRPHQPPYARQDAAASVSSVNSSTGSTRQRTNSNQSSSPVPSVRDRPQPNSLPARNNVTPSAPSAVATPRSTSPAPLSAATRPTAPPQRPPHARVASGASSISSDRGPTTPTSPQPARPSSPSSTPISAAAAAKRPVKPSPLSQGQPITRQSNDMPSATARPEIKRHDPSRRLSKDDSELTDLPASSGHGHVSRGSGGLKSRLRRALSFNAIEEIDPSSSKKRPTVNGDDHPGSPPESPITPIASAPIPTSSGKPKRSLFNSKFNASTDNISLSSTVSSASVMIRKLGGLARRNSLMSITSLFKDKDKDKDKDGPGEGSTKKGKKSKKGDKAEASVAHVTVELESGNLGGNAEELAGLTPAAKLARQHTLRSNAEAAARANAAKAGVSSKPANGTVLPTTWERNTATRQTESPIRAGRHAQQPSVTDEGTYRPSYDSGSDDFASDEENGGEEEDVTVKLVVDTSEKGRGEQEEVWAVGIRRSVERTRTPKRGILKYAKDYSQEAYLEQLNQPFTSRLRSNSYNTTSGQSTEPGPLARIPSPDPDHIDGLSHHIHSSSSSSNTSTLINVSTPSSESSDDSPLSTSPPASSSTPSARESFHFSFDIDFGGGLDLGGALGPILPPAVPVKDGRPRSGSRSSESSRPSFSGSDSSTLSAGSSNSTVTTHAPEKGPSSSFAYTHPALNSSAPVLSTLLSSSPSVSTNARPPVAPGKGKKITFAANLAIYDTFSPMAYDRRSEPATCNRLTPALAQRIKEELNSYKMEEMEVHAASRIHTHFFV